MKNNTPYSEQLERIYATRDWKAFPAYIKHQLRFQHKRHRNRILMMALSRLWHVPTTREPTIQMILFTTHPLDYYVFGAVNQPGENPAVYYDYDA